MSKSFRLMICLNTLLVLPRIIDVNVKVCASNNSNLFHGAVLSHVTVTDETRGLQSHVPSYIMLFYTVKQHAFRYMVQVNETAPLLSRRHLSLGRVSSLLPVTQGNRHVFSQSSWMRHCCSWNNGEWNHSAPRPVCIVLRTHTLNWQRVSCKMLWWVLLRSHQNTSTICIRSRVSPSTAEVVSRAAVNIPDSRGVDSSHMTSTQVHWTLRQHGRVKRDMQLDLDFHTRLFSVVNNLLTITIIVLSWA